MCTSTANFHSAGNQAQAFSHGRQALYNLNYTPIPYFLPFSLLPFSSNDLTYFITSSLARAMHRGRLLPTVLVLSIGDFSPKQSLPSLFPTAWEKNLPSTNNLFRRPPSRSLGYPPQHLLPSHKPGPARTQNDSHHGHVGSL